MSYFDIISPDPKEPLSAAEFRKVYSTWPVVEEILDREITAALPVIPQEKFDEAVRMEKLGAYKKLFWEIMKGFDLD